MNKSKKSIRTIRLNSRDVEVLSSIAEFGLLSTEQICALHFPSLHRARKRLLQFFRHQLVNRMERPTCLGEGSKARLYTVSRKGGRLLGKPGAKANNSKSVTPNFAEHLLTINRVRICFLKACQARRDLSLKKWVSDRQMKLRVEVRTEGGIQFQTIVPDSHFVIEASDRSYSYFLEVDRATASLKRMQMKMLAYHTLFANGSRDSSGSIGKFRVLIVTENAKRIKSYLDLLSALPAKFNRTDIFLFASLKDFNYGSPQTVFQPIWTQLTDRGTHQHAATFLPTLLTLPALPGNSPVYGPGSSPDIGDSGLGG